MKKYVLMLTVILAILLVCSVAYADTWEGVVFGDVMWEYKGTLHRKLTVQTGELVVPHIYLYSMYGGDIILKLEWVKNIPFATDEVIKTIVVSKYVMPGDVDIEVKPITSYEEGSYFFRVYIYTGPFEPDKIAALQEEYWKRIDPWTSVFGNPDRPEVTFQDVVYVTPTPKTPTPEPSKPQAVFVEAKWYQDGKQVAELTAGKSSEVEVVLGVKDFTGSIHVEVRKDIVMGFDELITKRSTYVDEDGIVKIKVPFTAPDASVRGVFVKVYGYVGGEYVSIYDKTNPSDRFADGAEVKVVEKVSPVTPTPTTTVPTPTTTPVVTTTTPVITPTDSTLVMAIAVFAGVVVALLIIALLVRK